MTAATAPSIVSVNIVGKAGTVEIDSSDASLVSDVVTAALSANGLDTSAITNLSVIKNGEDAELGDPVTAGDEVTATTKVANG